MQKEIKEILEALKPQDEEFTKSGIKEYPLVLSVKEQKILLDYITNLQTIEREYSAVLSENAELRIQISAREEEYIKLQEESAGKDYTIKEFMKANKELQEENERLKQIIKTANMMKYFKAYDILQGVDKE